MFGCPRAGLYRTPAVATHEAELRAAVERLVGAWPSYGYRVVTAMLRRDGWAANGKRVRRVTRVLGLAAEPTPRRVRTTDSDHPFPRYPNLVADLTVTRLVSPQGRTPLAVPDARDRGFPVLPIISR